MKKEFELGDVLTITTGLMLSKNGMGGIYEILNFMTGDNLFTHQLPRAMKECQPYLFRQFPKLAEIEAPKEQPTEGWREWGDRMAETHGKSFMVEAIPMDDHTVKDPLQEAQEMFPGKVIVVQP